MYEIVRVSDEKLIELQKQKYGHTIFTTYTWIDFLKRNQHIESVVLELSSKGALAGYFVGGITKKFGVKILGSPFEGWLTCDMGFVRVVHDFDNVEALEAVKNYAFKRLKCFFVQITDKCMIDINFPHSYIVKPATVLYVDNERDSESILEGFTKNGRRDVRASLRKGVVAKRVPFNKEFADCYYDQLIDVFDKQRMKPFYNIEKVYDLVEAFSTYPEEVLALQAVVTDEDGSEKVVATVISFAYGTWAYYLGAASYRKYQKYLPNEALMWEMIKHWNSKGIKKIDLVGYREYKLKYAPELIEYPTIVFERIPGLLMMKNFARKSIEIIRKII